MLNIEYRVRPVTRYIVTRFYSEISTVVSPDGVTASTTCGASGSDVCGEFVNQEMAQRVATALGQSEPEGTVTVNGAPVDSHP